MPRFEPAEAGVRVAFDDQEAELLRRLARELRDLLGGKRRRRDPVLDRLFPAAYADAADQAAYADLVGDDLERHKRQAIDDVSQSLGDAGSADVVITDDRVDAWLAFLTDVRLAIGTRIDVDEETMAADLDPRDPRAPALATLHWLGWVQEGILRTLAGDA